jgi:hypothetical protein
MKIRALYTLLFLVALSIAVFADDPVPSCSIDPSQCAEPPACSNC